jgi:hypothetical protein
VRSPWRPRRCSAVTLFIVSGDRITEPELLAHIDALEPGGPGALEFKRG